MNKLIALLFFSRDVAHRAHLMTKGIPGDFAMHEATGEFYIGIIGLADSVAEKWIGRNGPMSDIEFISMKMEGSILDNLEAHLSIVEDMRYQASPKEDTAIQNIIDEIVGLYLSTLFKLRTLK